jgi:hypothetical protein
MLLDSITDLSPAHCGLHIVAGSHGAAATGQHALGHGIASLICHDAGIGRDDAGVEALRLLDRAGVPAASVGHMSARIGDPTDMLARGAVTRLNAAARRMGLKPGMRTHDVHQAFLELAPTPDLPAGRPTGSAFRRFVINESDNGPWKVIALDSASSVLPSDAGCVIVTGSHGGLPGNKAAKALRARPVLAFFNDAGIGIDEAGIGRLPVLDAEGIAAACIHAWSARIGDGRSSYETGVISRVNQCATRLGAQPGMIVRDLIGAIAPASLEPMNRTQPSS